MIAATMILNRMSLSNSTLGEIHASLPQFVIVKDKINIQGIDLDNVIKKVTYFLIIQRLTLRMELNLPGTIDASNTEPIMRIYAEAPSHKQALEL